jgi:hypothetical protein
MITRERIPVDAHKITLLSSLRKSSVLMQNWRWGKDKYLKALKERLRVNPPHISPHIYTESN